MVNVGGQEYPLGIGGPASTLIVFTFTMIIIAMGLVANRIVYRRKKAGHLGWDDKTIIIALVSNHPPLTILRADNNEVSLLPSI